MTTATLAIIIFLVILVQIAGVMFLGIYRRKHQYRDLKQAGPVTGKTPVALHMIIEYQILLG